MNKTTINTLVLSAIMLSQTLTACARNNQKDDTSTPNVTYTLPMGAVDFTEAAESTVNGVVSIKSYNKVSNAQSMPEGMNDPFFEFFFGPQYRRQQPQRDQQPEERQSGLGSGVILSADGYIVTNNHVIDGASRLEVTLNDNRTFDAKVIGSDPATDIALIKIDADDLHVIPMGDSDNLKVGEWVLAVGNPFGLTSTVTAGIVSAKARNISSLTAGHGGRSGIESYIQTDAAVNPGNSGGALVNLQGHLVGINTAIFSQTGNYSGSSFAIPTSIVKKIVKDIEEYGTVQRAILGVEFRELTPSLAKEKNITATNAGLYVAVVRPNSAASLGGIKVDDVIVAIDGSATNNTAQLQESMARHRPGEKVTVTVVRNNKKQDIEVTLQNSRGDTEMTVAGDVSDLGCVIVPLTDTELKELGRSKGVKVTKVTNGKFKNAGIKEGFIILDINNIVVGSADDVRKVYDSIVQSDEYDHVMFITGKYPGKRKQYFAVDLDN